MLMPNSIVQSYRNGRSWCLYPRTGCRTPLTASSGQTGCWTPRLCFRGRWDSLRRIGGRTANPRRGASTLSRAHPCHGSPLQGFRYYWFTRLHICLWLRWWCRWTPCLRLPQCSRDYAISLPRRFCYSRCWYHLGSLLHWTYSSGSVILLRVSIMPVISALHRAKVTGTITHHIPGSSSATCITCGLD